MTTESLSVRMMAVLQLLLTAGCSLLAGLSGSLLAAFYPTEALKVGLSISLTGHVFGVRSDLNTL